MLKIKDNVDLKELEKYRFIYDEECGKYLFNVKCEYDKGGITITIQVWNRKIYLWSNTNNVRNEKIIEILYDLIQAGLVEKVEE